MEQLQNWITDPANYRDEYSEVKKGMTELNYPNPDGTGLSLLQFPALNALEGIAHCFSTRQGGVSTGILSSLNFGDRLGETREHLAENYRRLTAALGTDPSHVVCTHQTHTTNVRRVGREDAGRGVTRPVGYDDVDGLITDEPGLLLNAFGSDCPTIYFVDTVHRAIGLSHAGWRGTAGRIGAVTINAMAREFHTSPEDLLCAIGPGICQDCYEISEDVADVFRREFSQSPGLASILKPGRPGHWQLSLWKANIAVLTEAGVPARNISVSDRCTCCNPDRLFSHRATRGQRGNNGAFLMLRAR